MIDPSDLKALLFEEAARLGFHRAGIAPADPLRDHLVHLDEWVAAGHAAGMDYMETSRALREDPATLLPGARSVLCVLVDYRELEARHPDPGGAGGKVARYARARDYHIVLRKRLKKLQARLGEWAPEVESRVCVDSAPLLERAYAWRAGLGFLAKNTMLITPGVGSYTLLAELLLTAELPPDEPAEGTCGRCTRCLDACPTDAFPAPGVLDARRCISCWTIEHRGDLPADAALHGWAFGCDICQEVCPYNKEGEALPVGEDFETPRAAGARLAPAELAPMATREDLEARFAGTPLMRPGLDGLRRNLSRIEEEACNAGAGRDVELPEEP